MVPIGGTNIRCAAISNDGNRISKTAHCTIGFADRSPAYVLSLIGQLYDQIIEEVTILKGYSIRPIAIGVGQPGFFDLTAGTISALGEH